MSLATTLPKAFTETEAPQETSRFLLRARLGQGQPELCVLWNADEPLPLGHPPRWLVERSPAGGMRARRIPRELGKIEAAVILELSPDGKPVRAADGEEFSLRPARELAAPYGSAQGALLFAFRCRFGGKSVLSSEAIRSGHATLPGLELTPEGAGFSLVAKAAGVRWRDREVASGERLELERAQLAQGWLTDGQGQEWRFGFGTAAELPAGAALENPADLAERKLFNRALQTSMALTALIASLLFVSDHFSATKKDEAAIPAQFAKILLTPTKKSASASASAGGEAQALAKLPKKIQETAVVRAFRAQALQKSVHGLLKGGLTKLLAQSEFAMGAKASNEAKRLFDTKSDAMKATAPNVGDLSGREVKVASLGGEGIGGAGAGGGKGVGYGHGEHAGVTGQGNSFVSADLASSTVEEGLTKDEVGEVIHRHLAEIRYCYESAMIKRPDIEGKLMVAFTVGGSGSVKTSEIKSSTLPDPALDECVVRKLGTWAFPKPKGGVDVAVTYPFIFKTLGR